jgi:hypothetical protein
MLNKYYSTSILAIVFLLAACNLEKIEENPSTNTDLPEFERHFQYKSGMIIAVKSVVEAIDSGYVISGVAENSTFTFSELFVVKTNKAGTVTKIQNNFGNFGSIRVGYLVKGSNAYYLIGTEEDGPDSQIILVKINTDLTIAWAKEIGLSTTLEVANSAAITPNGDLLVAGAKSSGSGPYDPFFLKIGAANGNIIDSATINIINSGSFLPASITRSGTSYGVMGYNLGVSLPFNFFMKIDENLNALIPYKTQPDLGNYAGVILPSSNDGFILSTGVSAQLERQAYISSLNGNGDQIARFDQFLSIPESGFLSGCAAHSKYVACGWGAQVLGTDQFGIAALLSSSLSTEATYEYSQNGILTELTACNPASDGGFILAGAYNNGKEILLVKLNSNFLVN